jgi:hypothetical protein
MHLYFGGAEQKGWRELLNANHVTHVSLSYVGLTRRSKRASSLSLSDLFDDGVRIFVDSGAYTVNKDPAKYPAERVEELAQEYLAFVANNLDRIEMASEFDADAMGRDWLTGMREDFWVPDVGDKFLPIWKEGDPLTLRDMAAEYQRIGIMQPESSLNLVPLINRIVKDYATQFHGVGMTSMHDMEEVRFSSVGSTSWLSPSQYGDTFVWDGREMHRYPKKYKERARTSHRTYLLDQGFDADAIFADDVTENLRLSIWSWQKFVKFRSYDARHPAPVQTRLEVDEQDERLGAYGDQVTHSVLEPFPGAREIAKTAVAHALGETRNTELATPAPKKLLPVIGMIKQTHTEHDDEGNEIEVETTLMKASDNSLMRCNDCFIQDKCPSFHPGNACAYEIPVKARTNMQRDAIEDTMIEIQTQRVAMLRMIEQVNGGYPDPNLGPEMDRLTRMLVKKNEVEIKRNNPTASLTITASGAAGGGMIAGMFGQKAADKLHEVDEPQSVAEIMAGTEIVDAVVVDE